MTSNEHLEPCSQWAFDHWGSNYDSHTLVGVQCLGVGTRAPNNGSGL